MSDASEARIHFDAALTAIFDLLRDWLPSTDTGIGMTVLVRDVYGKFRLVFEHKPDDRGLSDLSLQLERVAGVFLPQPESRFLFKDDLVAPEAVFSSADRTYPFGEDVPFSFIDRGITGVDWLRSGRLPNERPTPARCVFFGLKGGVGRSTALVMLAHALSRRGKRVLVLDMDLESPGLSSALLPMAEGAFPSHGIVDWFVEEAVAQVDKRFLRDMVGTSPLSSSGDILVAPAYGWSKDQDYLAKLSRAYLDIPSLGGATRTFAARLAAMIDALEREYEPHVVLIDSRAGMHDISAATLTRLGARTLLFAMDTEQTWRGYHLLFSHWRYPPRISEIRDGELRGSLRMVAAAIPQAESPEAYLASFSRNACDVWRGTLYEEIPPEDDPTFDQRRDYFNYDEGDREAPHFPIPIFWHGAYTLFDPMNARRREAQLAEGNIEMAFGRFIAETLAWLDDDIV
jgi:hypothetical protein